MSFTSLYFEPVYSLSEFNRLFDDAFNSRTQSPGSQNQVARGSRGSLAGPFSPSMDVHESADNNQITATFELPGLKKEDVQIDVHNNRLSISGETKSSAERQEEGYAVRERKYGKFTRTLPLPTGTKAEEIKASMENGVLTVTFPKHNAEQAPKRVSIS
ncbi:hypothetical protein BOTBODRAFT_168535 [Botryobasidium botryosum FD-172 SS1]|uniref:SHSP domain-containing protein n=1 Tax=Botryobasidium botryosum (strain FD-172 SS1) TaxID=930990 RepID=A0A067N2N4_BOTB1|nr:hypothetical protein BOTBODRAFT_168535 [Botryobasidium botryosum FD-172 SS1]